MLLTIRDSTVLMTSRTAVLRRIKGTRRKEIYLTCCASLAQYSNFDFNPQTRGKLTWYGRVTTCLWNTCFKGWCRWWLSWHFQCWKSFGSRICMWKLCLNSQHLKSTKFLIFLLPRCPFRIISVIHSPSGIPSSFKGIQCVCHKNFYGGTGIYFLKSLFKGDFCLWSLELTTNKCSWVWYWSHSRDYWNHQHGKKREITETKLV